MAHLKKIMQPYGHTEFAPLTRYLANFPVGVEIELGLECLPWKRGELYQIFVEEYHSLNNLVTILQNFFAVLTGHAWIIHGALQQKEMKAQTTLVIALDALTILFCIFTNTTAYHLGRYEPAPPSTKEFHGSLF